MTGPRGPDGLIGRLERLYPAVVADCLDKVGLRDNVMSPDIRPLFPDARAAGFAFTVHAVESEAVPEDPADNYRNELLAVDALREGDVMVVSTVRRSVWGELLATAARYRGTRGIVIDGFTRDSKALIAMQFPTFITGIQCQDSLGRVDVADLEVPIQCGGVTVRPGDLVLADFDGVVVVPVECADEVLTLAERKVSDENQMRARLAGGAVVSEAFRKYQVL
jgi:4-hydroxy-4-methyl-2-oxoglutarate aldolase